MSDTLNSILLTTNTHPLILGLTLFTLALFISFTLIVLAFNTALHSDPYDCEENINLPSSSEEATRTNFFSKGETRPLLLDEGWLDRLKDFPHGRRDVVKANKRAKKQRVERARLRGVLVADWAGSGYGYSSIKGPRVGEKRRRGDEGVGRGKRVRVEESGEDGDW